MGSIGLTNESGHSVRSMSTTLFGAKQGTSTLAPVGNVYVDDVKGNRACASIFVRPKESDTMSCGVLSRYKRKLRKHRMLELHRHRTFPCYLVRISSLHNRIPKIGKGSSLHLDPITRRSLTHEMLPVLRICKEGDRRSNKQHGDQSV